MKVKLSANLGFLWNDLSLPDAIRAAAAAGFDAVECHWPYATPAADIKAALDETGLKMLGLNSDRGNLDAGENGTAVLPGRESETHTSIDDAIAYARAIGCGNIHVMAGFASGDEAEATFVENLKYATKAAAPHGITILLEPLNNHFLKDYFLNNAPHAAQIIEKVGAPNIKLMFDCFHLQIMRGDLLRQVEKYLPIIGHIQFAAPHDRGEPDQGEVNFAWLLPEIEKLGYSGTFGAEYKPRGSMEEGLGWMDMFRS